MENARKPTFAPLAASLQMRPCGCLDGACIKIGRAMNMKWPGQKIWRQYPIYGELLCFLLAWIIGLVVVFTSHGRSDLVQGSNVAATDAPHVR